MEQRGVKLDQETLSCSICLNLLEDPVTIPCGHSYCMNCIKTHWDTQTVYSCPQCRRTFTPRPALLKNTMLAAVVEELKKSRHQASPEDHCYAGPEDVACDSCTGRKLKAQKSCLQCLASYCKKHLQPHLESATFKKHKLVEPSKRLRENVCTRHDEVMKIFCRTDQQSVCQLCVMDEHKGHDTVSAAAERTQRQRQLEEDIQQMIQGKERDVKTLQQEADAISRSADKAVDDSEKIFTKLISLIEKQRSDVKQKVRSTKQTEVSRVRELQKKLEQEITELKRKGTELETLSRTEDHIQFLRHNPSQSGLRKSTHTSSFNIRPLKYFEGVTAAVSEVREKLQQLLRETWTKISETVTGVDVLLSEPEPKTRAEFLEYSRDLTLDPNTVNEYLLLSDGNRKVTRTSKPQSYPSHPDRFNDCNQVLSRQSLTARCYWEVERKGSIYVAVAYKTIHRVSGLTVFGYNDISWVLNCFDHGYRSLYNKVSTDISGPRSSRIGVYLNHSAGILSFYSVSETMTLLHRVQTVFTEPLYAGFWVGDGANAEICKLK